MPMPELLRRMRELGSVQWIVESAPAAWKADASMWGPVPDGLAVMCAIKQEFDPAGILNRGRLSIENR
jgi:FAD/FMN-containing dehydrogenase